MDFHDLLVVIHRDGGHYEQEHGTEKAIRDAIDIIIKERSLLYGTPANGIDADLPVYQEIKWTHRRRV